MKDLLKLITGVIIGLGPAALIFYFWYFKFAAYIISVIPGGQWHALLGVLVYIVMTIFGGFEFVVASFILGIFLAGLFIVGTEKL
jgi:hypothetical protein